MLSGTIAADAVSFLDFNGLDPGQVYIYQFDATNSNGSTPSNTTKVGAPASCPGAVNNTADLSASGTATPSPVPMNSTLTYTATVSNAGPNPATGVTATIPVPAGATFASVQTSQGSAITPPIGAAGSIVATLGDVPPGIAATVTATFLVNAAPGLTLTTSVLLTSSSIDPNLGNNSSLAMVSVVSPISSDAQTSAAAALDDLRNQLNQPMPQFQGNWAQVLVQQLFSSSSYNQVYTDGVNLHTLAANALASAYRFLAAGDLTNESKYQGLTINFLSESANAFSAADQISLGLLKLTTDTVYTLYKIDTLAGGVVAGLVCGGVLVCTGAADAAGLALDYSVDRSVSGPNAALKGAITDAIVDVLFDGTGLGDQLEAVGQDELHQSGLYDQMTAALQDASLTDKLTKALTAAGVQAAESLAESLIDAASDYLKGAVFQSPPSLGQDPVSTQPFVTATGVVSAASYGGATLSPGEIVTVFGTNFGPDTSPSSSTDERPKIFTAADELSTGVTILFDGIPAPLIYAQPNQLAAVVPYGLSGQDRSQVQVEYKGNRSFPVTVPIGLASVAVFTIDSSGKGAGAILNQDGSINSADNPAEKGSIIAVYGTGVGQTDPPGVDGQIATTVLPKPQLQVTAMVGGLPADVIYAGAAPDLVAGVTQVNLRIPAGSSSGKAVSILLNVGGVNSQDGVTVAIR
jgi:uncharacterized protein (TIGR03437 family)